MEADERAALKQRFDNMTKGELVIALLTAHERLDELKQVEREKQNEKERRTIFVAAEAIGKEASHEVINRSIAAIQADRDFYRERWEGALASLIMVTPDSVNAPVPKPYDKRVTVMVIVSEPDQPGHRVWQVMSAAWLGDLERVRERVTAGMFDAMSPVIIEDDLRTGLVEILNKAGVTNSDLVERLHKIELAIVLGDGNTGKGSPFWRERARQFNELWEAGLIWGFEDYAGNEGKNAARGLWNKLVRETIRNGNARRAATKQSLKSAEITADYLHQLPDKIVTGDNST